LFNLNMHTKKQEIVFVSPRMHTNEFGITKCLLEQELGIGLSSFS